MNYHLAVFLQNLRQKSRLVAAISLQFSGSVHDDGWFESVAQNQAVDRKGNPIPWISYPSLHFLNKKLPTDISVFEFGAGNSTLWWAGRAKKVVACEADKGWHAQLQKKAPSNMDVIYAEEADYTSILKSQKDFPDIIVIDGGDRLLCAQCAIQHLSSKGIIVWDDSNRAEYASGISQLIKSGFSQLEFTGLGPIVSLTKETSIFYRPGNLLSI